MTLNIYSQYFSAKLLFNDVPRRAAKDEHNDEEQQLLAEFCDHIDELAKQAEGEVHWEQPLREAKWE